MSLKAKLIEFALKNSPKIIKYVAIVGSCVFGLMFLGMGGSGSGSGSGQKVTQGTMPVDGDYNVYTESPYSAPVIRDKETLKKALSWYSSNQVLLRDEVLDAFLEMQETYKVNAIFAAAVSIAESSGGTNGVYANSYNTMFNYQYITGIENVKGYDGLKGDYSYCGWTDISYSILGFGYFIANGSNYFKAGNYTVSDICLKGHYCIETDGVTPSQAWVNNNIKYMTNFYETAGITAKTQTAGGKNDSFENFLFIGDSITVGLGNEYGGISGATQVNSKGVKDNEFKNAHFYAKQNESANYWNTNISTLPTTDIKAICVLLGVNEVATSDNTKNMKPFIDNLVQKYGANIPIYIQKVFPVGSGYTTINSSTMNGYIKQYNDGISTYISDKGWSNVHFIDTSSGLVDSNGYLNSSMTDDSLHLNSSGKSQWVKNLRDYFLN